MELPNSYPIANSPAYNLAAILMKEIRYRYTYRYICADVDICYTDV